MKEGNEMAVKGRYVLRSWRYTVALFYAWIGMLSVVMNRLYICNLKLWESTLYFPFGWWDWFAFISCLSVKKVETESVWKHRQRDEISFMMSAISLWSLWFPTSLPNGPNPMAFLLHLLIILCTDLWEVYYFAHSLDRLLVNRSEHRLLL